ncbi:sensor histidine kinase [Salinimicrobium sediminilitoris]|uniref:sensor histidine kinase n=1 Tax=Salinimicrobium sediminilitoris TaxID=2876715 RepID=UPI001E2CD3B7|nr:HAMP domain-containing sensor histidine kinase [Salinimicrobium sediminilitoris]MCC8360447.1 HAMP domain-containing histidine kinase [Salinimicrobium sediminilitoris]
MPKLEIKNTEGRQHPAPEEFQILKTSADSDFSDILFLCTQVVQARTAALIILENEQIWVKSTYGTPIEELNAETSLWKKVLEQNDILIFHEQELRSSGLEHEKIIAVPVITKTGERLGLISLFDASVRELTPNQRRSLKLLVIQILNFIAFRKQNNQFQRVQQDLEKRYEELEKFASVVSHDIKSPLANIISLVDLLKEEKQEKFDEEAQQYIDYLSQASHSLRNYVDGLLIFYRSERILEKEQEDVDLKPFFENIVNLYNVSPDVEITYPKAGVLKRVNKAALTQIFLNLISNALKYNHKDKRRVEIEFKSLDHFYQFQVKDNGDGIPKESFTKIFDLFTTLDQNDRDGNPGSGIGLATVQKLLTHMGGNIKIASEPGMGSNFKFQIKRSY